MIHSSTYATSSSGVNTIYIGGSNIVSNTALTTNSNSNTYRFALSPQGHGPVSIDKDWVGDIVFPDGTIIKVDCGNFTIHDNKAKIVYRGNRFRDFNKFLAGSDLMEEFIKYLGTLNLSQEEVLKLPLESFIMWLIVSAAEQDQEDRPEAEVLMLESSVKSLKKPRCRCCGRFMRHKRKAAGIEFCNGAHMDKWEAKALAA